MLFLMGSIIVFTVSCKNDIQTINALFGPERPTMVYHNVALEYTDTAKLQAKLITETLEYYTNSEEPFYEFPDGIEVIFYGKNKKVKSIITSKYAIFKEKQELFEVRDSVVAKDIEGGQIVETEQMFWDQAKKKIYSEVFTKISNEDGVHFGEQGFEASQDLTYYRLIGSTGKMNLKDEE